MILHPKQNGQNIVFYFHNMKKFLQKYIREIVLLGMIFLLMGNSLFQKGGIFLLDYIATPHWDANILQNAWFVIPQIPASIFGYEIGTKLTFIFILVISYYLGIFITK